MKITKSVYNKFLNELKHVENRTLSITIRERSPNGTRKPHNAKRDERRKHERENKIKPIS